MAAVEEPRWLALLNGAGKTTLLRAISGLLPRSGRVRFAGKGSVQRLSLRHGPSRARARDIIGRLGRVSPAMSRHCVRSRRLPEIQGRHPHGRGWSRGLGRWLHSIAGFAVQVLAATRALLCQPLGSCSRGLHHSRSQPRSAP
ncbi:MAG: ATP-binding cassette domain-containing protein [Hyphomicrobiaceae bacterium]|nr:MAG: ATP-binding cassette domain-containing protein [Hyphomicrobiaceae bacterium]